jgi:hypothetical protein
VSLKLHLRIGRQGCLAKNIDQRPMDARMVRDELRACTNGGGWTADDATAWWKQHGDKLAEAALSARERTGLTALSTVLRPPGMRLLRE